MSKIVYLNRELVPLEQATISVFNGGWLHGAGLFETMHAHQGRVFRLDQHLDRLCASTAKLLAPIDRGTLPSHDAFARLLRENNLTDARVRLTVSAGDMLEAVQSRDATLTICATASPLAAYPKELYETGMTVLISKYRQSRDDPLTGHKTTNYLSRLIALNEARRARCDEALWFTADNHLAEASISNVFVVKSGVVRTPPLDTPVLPGIARAVVLEICEQSGIETAQDAMTVDDLLDADEIFLTNSIMRIMPVKCVEKQQIGSHQPGPVTLGLIEQYQQLLDRECPDDA